MAMYCHLTVNITYTKTFPVMFVSLMIHSNSFVLPKLKQVYLQLSLVSILIRDIVQTTETFPYEWNLMGFFSDLINTLKNKIELI